MTPEIGRTGVVGLQAELPGKSVDGGDHLAGGARVTAYFLQSEGKKILIYTSIYIVHFMLSITLQ